MIGGKTSTAGFMALGVRTFPVDRPEQAPEVWKKVDTGRYGLILVTEPVYLKLTAEIESFQERTLPVVTVIPAVKGSEGIGSNEIRALVEKATGTSMVIRRGAD